MKKLLVVAVAALMTSTAFAQKHMVRFTDFDGSGGFDSFNVDFNATTGSGNTKDSETSENNFNINYAYAVTNDIQVGVTYKNKTRTGGDEVTMGFSGYYNLDGKVNDTCYVALHYMMTTESDDDKSTTIGLEYGHRFALGSWKGLNLAYSPAISLSQTTFVKDDDSAADYEDQVTSALAWNFFKFDVLF